MARREIHRIFPLILLFVVIVNGKDLKHHKFDLLDVIGAKWRPFNSRFQAKNDNFPLQEKINSYDDYFDYSEDEEERIPDLGEVKFFVEGLKDRIGNHLSELLSEEDETENEEPIRKHHNNQLKPQIRGLREFLMPQHSKMRKFQPLPLLGMKRKSL